LYKVGVTCENVPEETNLCCSTKDTEIWNNVWSVQERRRPTTDQNKNAGLINIHNDTNHDILNYVVTNSYDVKEDLVSDRSSDNSSSWNEACAGTKGSTVFCYGNPDGRDGPFIVYNTEASVPEAKPLYRCCGYGDDDDDATTTDTGISSSTARSASTAGSDCGSHFLWVSSTSTCEDIGSVEEHIGWISPNRGGEALRRCRRNDH